MACEARIAKSQGRIKNWPETTFIISPDTISITQALDQINASLHSAYSEECDRFFRDNHINREVFMEVLGAIWSKWTNQQAMVKAFQRVGISTSGLSVEWMQQDKFVAAEAIIHKEPVTPIQRREVWEVDSPEGLRKDSNEYLKEKCKLYREKLKEQSETPISPDEIPGFLKVDKIKVPATKKAVRLTQITGSMEGSKILELREQAELALKEKEKVKERKKQDKKGQCESFLKCKVTCICDSILCDATGLKQCIVCQDVMKSQCTKSKCKVNGIKLRMIMCHFDIEKKLQGSSKRQSSLKRKLTIENEETESESDSLSDLDISSDGSDDDLLDDCDNDGINDGQDSSSEQLYGEELSHKKVKEGMWVVVEYEGKSFWAKFNQNFLKQYLCCVLKNLLELGSLKVLRRVEL